jgi:hypothetical protein
VSEIFSYVVTVGLLDGVASFGISNEAHVGREKKRLGRCSSEYSYFQRTVSMHKTWMDWGEYIYPYGLRIAACSLPFVNSHSQWRGSLPLSIPWKPRRSSLAMSYHVRLNHERMLSCLDRSSSWCAKFTWTQRTTSAHAGVTKPHAS